MRVDFVAPRFHPSTGGIESAMTGLAEELIGRGHEVTVHTTHFPELVMEERWNGIQIRRYKPFPRLGYYASWFRPRLEGDVVHLHAYGHGTNDWVVRQGAQGRPVFLSTHHGLAFPKRNPLGRLWHALYNPWRGIPAARRVTGLLVPTPFDADLFRQRGVDADRIHVFPTGLPEEAFANPVASPPPWVPEGGYALYLGRLHREKGVFDLAQAFDAAEDRFGLVFAGPDEGARTALERWAAHSRKARRVKIVGSLSPHEKWAVLDGALFLALPSHHEGQGIVAVEAWARGKAVLAARAGGLAHLVREGEDGFLVGVQDVEGLASGLTRLAADAALRDRLGRRGRERARAEFRRGPLVDQLVAWYEAALTGSGGGSSAAPATGRTA